MYLDPSDIQFLLDLVHNQLVAAEDNLEAVRAPGGYETREQIKPVLTEIHAKLQNYIKCINEPPGKSPMSEDITGELLNHLSGTASMAYSHDIYSYAFAVVLTTDEGRPEPRPHFGHFGGDWVLPTGLAAAQALLLSKLIAESDDIFIAVDGKKH